MNSVSICYNLTCKCNLSCLYCFEKDKDLSTEEIKLDLESICNSTKSLLTSALGMGYVTFEFIFFGGEPLLEFKLIEKILHFIEENYSQIQKKYMIVTNGVLLTEEILKFYLRYNFYINFSIDGVSSTMNRNRIFRDGSSPFEIIIKNIQKVVENLSSQFVTAQMVIDPNNLSQLYDDVRFLIGLKFKNIVMNPLIVEQDIWLPHIDNYKNSIRMIYKALGNNKEVRISPFNDMLERINSKSNTYGCGLGNAFYTVNKDGNVFPCYRYIYRNDWRDWVILTKDQSMNKELYDEIKEYKKNLIFSECVECKLKYNCHRVCFYENKTEKKFIKKDFCIIAKAEYEVMEGFA